MYVRGQLAQSVEQRPEKPRVRSSILRLPTISTLILLVLSGWSQGIIATLPGFPFSPAIEYLMPRNFSITHRFVRR